MYNKQLMMYYIFTYNYARLNLFTWLKTHMDGQKITTPCGKRSGKLPGKIRVPGTRKISETVKRVSSILSQTLRASSLHPSVLQLEQKHLSQTRWLMHLPLQRPATTRLRPQAEPGQPAGILWPGPQACDQPLVTNVIPLALLRVQTRGDGGGPRVLHPFQRAASKEVQAPAGSNTAIHLSRIRRANR